MKQFTFQNNDTMPALGLGTWQSGTDEVYNAVLEALRLGYRHIDCAYIYKNEKEVGQALDYAFRYGIVKRDEIFVTSKLWNADHAPARVEAAINRTLANLQLKYLDLYLIHWSVALKEGTDFPETGADFVDIKEVPLADTWNAMAVLKEKSLTRHIGVSNFNIPKINDFIKKTNIKPEVNQVEIHPYLQQKELVEFCQKNNIIVTAYSPLGGRKMVHTSSKIQDDSTIASIAEKHQATPTQVILAWGIQRGVVVIPKSVNAERIQENFSALNLKLSADEMLEISKLDKNLRVSDGSIWTIDGSPYTQKWLWEE
jgi:alcohol dehydrogenase (NADP+)